jgi:CRP/FNR family transcriptional regulator, cyclic AMP receptor protein
MSTPHPPQMTLAAIRSVPLFASLHDESARELRELLRTRYVEAGTLVFRAGDEGDAMYLIESGRVQVSVTGEGRKTVVLADLAQGDFFGEMAIIDGQRRSADATVSETARLAMLSREDFLSFIRNNPSVAIDMLSAIFSRLRRMDQMLQERVSRNVNEEQDKRMTVADRAADLLASFGGSWTFIGAAGGVMVFWMVLNSYILTKGFDPAPFQMLNLMLAVVAGLQAPIIMMSQNRESQKDRLRADLDYQVNLKNEIALTEVLRRLDVLESERLPSLFAEQQARMSEATGPTTPSAE